MSTGVKKKIDEEASQSLKKKQIALHRWQILGETLRGRCISETQNVSVSVRRFHTFGLLQTQKIDRHDEEGTDWYQYTCSSFPHLVMKIRHVSETIRPEVLLGFNNTGNVCVWPSEEVMAYYCLQRFDQFRASCVIELGGGMTCLAGVALACSSVARQVILTDGNEQSMSNLQSIIQENNFGDTEVSARLLRWGSQPLHQDLHEALDYVLCADCWGGGSCPSLFFDEGREHLVDVIFSLLKPGGSALVFAPGRHGTFNKFRELAKAKFVVQTFDQYDDHVWKMHSELKTTSQAYSEDLHLPLLMKLTKHKDHDTDSRDTTPESR